MSERSRRERSHLRAAALVGTGAAGALGARDLLRRAALAKLRRDVSALNHGDYRPLLAGFAPRATLRFADGEHRWAGEHRGREAIERFLQDFVAAGLHGEVRELTIAGPPWRMTLLVRFDDRALDPDGSEIYRNRTVLLARARWGRIVWQEDFYEDTGRIAELERRLTARGVLRAR